VEKSNTDEDHDYDVTTEREGRFAPFCAALLYECLAKEKPEMVKTYISLYEVVRCVEQEAGVATTTVSINSGSSSSTPASSANGPLLLSIYLQNVRLIATYYNHTARAKKAPNDEPLIQAALFNSFLHRIHSHFMRCFSRLPVEVKRDYFSCSSASSSPSSPSSPLSAGGALPSHADQRRALALMLAYYDLPHPRRLRRQLESGSGQLRPSFVQLALQYPHVSPSLLSSILLLARSGSAPQKE
jgi:hypothetical protein